MELERAVRHPVDVKVVNYAHPGFKYEGKKRGIEINDAIPIVKAFL